MKHEDNYKYGRFYLKINGKQAESSTTKKIKSKKIKIIYIYKKKKINTQKKGIQKNKTNLKSLSLLRFGLQKFKVDFHRSKHEVYL